MRSGMEVIDVGLWEEARDERTCGVGIEVLERETKGSMGNSAKVKVSCWIKDRNTDADEDDRNGNLVSWNNTCLVMYIWPDNWSRHKYPLCIRLADKNTLSRMIAKFMFIV